MLKKLLIGATIFSCSMSVLAQTLRIDIVQEAVKRRDEVALGTIVKAYKTLDAVDKNGKTALCHAINEKDYDGYALLLKYGADRTHECVQKMSAKKRAEFNSGLREHFEKGGPFSGSALLWEAGTLAAGGALIGLAVDGKGSGDDKSGNSGSNGSKGNEVTVGKEGLSGEDLTASDLKTQAYIESIFLDKIQTAEAWARYYTGDKNDKGQVTNIYSNLKDIKVGVIDSGVEKIAAFDDRLLSGFNYDYGPCSDSRSKNCWKYNILGFATLIDGNGKESTTVGMDLLNWLIYAAGYSDNYVWDKTLTTPKSKEDWHGTAVSAIIGAKYQPNVETKEGSVSFTPGVAQNAKIIPVRYDMMSGLSNPIISLVDSGAKVINISLGVPSAAGQDASIFKGGNWKNGMKMIGGDLEGLAYLSKKQSAALVFAAGNDRRAEPSLNAGTGLLSDINDSSVKKLYGNLKDLMVSVVSVDKNNNISNFSNKCGSTKDYCIAAPGDNIELTLEQSRDNESISYTEYGKGVTELDGTSFAAPTVSGALAFLLGAYPNMTPSQAIDLIFETATDLGKKGVDEEYGHGLLNLNAATQPQGEMTMATTSAVNGEHINLSETRLKMPRVMQNLVAQMPAGFTAFDKYKRSFTMPTSSLISVNDTDGKTFQNALHRFMQFDSVKTIGNDDEPMRFSFSTATNTDSEMGVGSMDISLNFGNSSVRFYYMEDGTYGTGDYVDKSLVNPFMAIDNAYGFENTYRLSDKYALSFGLVSGDNALFKTNEDDMEEANQLSIFQSSATYKPNDKLSLGIVGGALSEENALMGLRGNGGFNIKNTKTYYTGAMAQINPIKNLTLTGTYYYGITPATHLNSFIQTGDLHSEAVSFDARYHFDNAQYMGLLLSSPLRVRSGHADLTLPVGRDYYSDTVYMNAYRLKMAPKAREWNTGIYGQFNLAENVRAKMKGLIRFNPEHQANVKPDYQVMFGLNWLWH